MSTVMDNLGMDDKIIENLNLIKIWQRVLKDSFPRGWLKGVPLSGGFWLLLVQGEPKKESFTILSPFVKPSE